MIQPLIFALSFLGLLAGIIISFFTKEELKPGRKYFTGLERAILLFISLVIIFYIKGFFLFFVLGALAGFIFRRVYFYFGIALALTSGQFLLLMSSLVFLFGLPHGTLLASRSKEKKMVMSAIYSAVFFFAAVLLSYLLEYDFLLMFASGALMANSVLKKF